MLVPTIAILLVPLALPAQQLVLVQYRALAEFEVQTRYLGTEPVSLVAADLDADGAPDLAIVTRESGVPFFQGRLSVLRGTGTGRFVPVWDAVFGSVGSLLDRYRVRAFDVNADGFGDLAIAGSPNLKMLRPGDGSLVYETAVPVPTVGGDALDVAFPDFDGDGLLDPVVLVNDFGNWLDWSLNQGHSTFGEPGFIGSFSVGNLPHLIRADLDGDGDDADLVVSGEKRLIVLGWSDVGPLDPPLMQWDGHFGEAATADLDLDGDLDLVVAEPVAHRVRIWANDGTGIFAPGAQLFPGRYPEFLAAADFDHDGAPDVAVSNAVDGTVAILRGDGNGGLTLDAAYSVGAGPRVVSPADLDLDGDVDLVVANRLGLSFSVLFNTKVP